MPVVSPFLEFSDQIVRSRDGTSYVVVYASTTPTVAMLPVELANELANRRDPTDLLSPGALDALLERRILVTDSQQETARVRNEMGEAERDASTREFVLLPTSYCNMSCTYCGQEHTKGRLSENHRQSMTARVLEAIRQPTTRNVHIAWFGAEPLMAYTEVIDMARKFIAEAKAFDRGYSSKITTNGALLSPRKLTELVQVARVTRFDITIDGPREVHNEHRPLKSGMGSFDSILETLKYAAESPAFRDVIFVLRTNVDRHNLRHLDEYLTEMSRRGFTDDRFVFQLSPIHSWGNDISELGADRSDVSDLEVTWFRRMAELGLNHRLLPGKIASTTCVATHVGSEVVDQYGRMYSCTEQPLVPRDIGATMLTTAASLAATARRPRGRFDDWATSVEHRPYPCKSCSLFPVCGGGCPKRWEEGEVACPSMRANFRQRLTLAAERAGFAPVEPFVTRSAAVE